MNYYVMKNNVQQGPFSEEDMEVMYIARRLLGSTPVWYEGSENWIRFCEAPVFEAFESRKKRNIFLCMISLYIFPIQIPYFFIVFAFYILCFGWREIVSVAKNIKNSDNKKYDIFLLCGGLQQVIGLLSCFLIPILDKHLENIDLIGIICALPRVVLLLVLAIYSGGWKEILSAWRRIFFAFKKAHILAKQFK